MLAGCRGSAQSNTFGSIVPTNAFDRTILHPFVRWRGVMGPVGKDRVILDDLGQ